MVECVKSSFYTFKNKKATLSELDCFQEVKITSERVGQNDFSRKTYDFLSFPRKVGFVEMAKE